MYGKKNGSAPEMNPMSRTAILLAGFQWLFFMFANIVVIPVTVGAALHMDAAGVAGFMQRSFFFTGVACLAQAWLGHRLPLMEGQSGLWWGVVLNMCASAPSMGVTLKEAGGSLEVGMILVGTLIILLGLLGLGNRLRRWFSPVVMGTFLILLAVQLIIIFFRGMVGLMDHTMIQVPEAVLSVFLIALVAFLTIAFRGWISNFAILIGMVTGWVAYHGLISGPSATATNGGKIFQLFAWGPPAYHTGIIITAILAGLLNTTNTVSALRGAETLLDRQIGDREYRRSFVMTGIMAMVSGLFGLVAYAPYTSSIGFLRTTRILSVLPFIVGAVMFTIMGIVPGLGAFFSTLPVSVGNAVLFVAYLQLFGSALQSIEGIRFTHRTIFRMAAPTLLGIAIMSLPSGVFVALPAIVRPFLESGMLVGILLVVLLENTVPWDRLD
jgi:xanthine/uracil permease